MNLLRERIYGNDIVKFIGVHDVIGAKIAEECGCDALWISGFGIAATYGVPDANILSYEKILDMTRFINDSVHTPILVDCDNGFGDIHNTIFTVQQFEKAGASGISIEDKIFPKRNSFLNVEQNLVPIDEFCNKIKAANKIKRNNDFVIVARTEALIAGKNCDYAIERCYAYEQSGADALIVHSKEKNDEIICRFMEKWNGKIPIIIIPTTYPQITVSEALSLGISGIIYANQGLRGNILNMKKIFNEILKNGTSFHIENDISEIKEVYNIQGFDMYLGQHRTLRFENAAKFNSISIL